MKTKFQIEARYVGSRRGRRVRKTVRSEWLDVEPTEEDIEKFEEDSRPEGFWPVEKRDGGPQTGLVVAKDVDEYTGRGATLDEND